MSKEVRNHRETIPTKQTKQKARKEVKTKKLDEEFAKVVQVAERRVYRPNIKTKHWESESPSSEVLFNKDFTLFDEAWKAGYPLLVKTVIAHMEQKHPNMKLDKGVEYTVIKQTTDLEGNDPDEVKVKKVGDAKPRAARTKASEQLYGRLRESCHQSLTGRVVKKSI